MLRDYQQSAVDAVINWLAYKDTPAIVNLPTGAGKSHVIGALAEHYAAQSKRVLIIAHRQELLKQIAEKIYQPYGFYGASLGNMDANKPITIAQIQSIYNKDIPLVDIIICDECHCIPNKGDDEGEGQYWNLINKHQGAKLIGLSATPYRLKGGKLGWGEEIFSIAYATLLDQDYLAPISNKLLQDATPKLDDIDIKLGEYVQSQLEIVMEDPALIEAAAKAIIAYSHDRHSCLVFCVSINHGKLLAKVLEYNGITDVIFICGETSQGERETHIEQFKAEYGNVRYLINCELFLVGFDAPNIDAIFCLRPTKSKALWEQMVGRGVRKAEGKTNCLLVDMAGNLKEHGPLGSPFRGKAKKEAPDSGGKICPECEEFVKPLTKECPDCGYTWPEPETPKVSHEYNADTQSGTIYQGDIITHDVESVNYRKHKSKKGNDTIRIDYHCNFGKYGSISEWCVKWKLEKHFKQRGYVLGGPIDDYSWDDLLWHCEQMKKPIRITVNHARDFPDIIKYEFSAEKQPAPRIIPPASVTLDDDYIPW